MKKPQPKTTTKPAVTKNLPTKTSSKNLMVLDEFDNGQASPAGLENVTAADLIIPRLTILQPLSPQLIKSDKLFIKGASAGQFCDTATGEVWDDELIILPVFFARVFIEWAPRASGKGLVKNYGVDASIMDKTTRDDKNRAMLKNGNYIAETATYYALNMNAKGRRSFIPLTSTQLGSSRRWMMKITGEKLQRKDGSEYTPPIYYRSYKATITENQNNEGSWFGWTFEPDATILELDPSKKLLEEAKEFYHQASSGLVKGDLSRDIAEDAVDQDGRM